MSDLPDNEEEKGWSVVDEIKKTTVRFNLENEQDKQIWIAIQKKPERKRNQYIKYLIDTGLHQEEQTNVLEELAELKNMLIHGNLSIPSDETAKIVLNERKDGDGELDLQEPIVEQRDKEQPEHIEIDADVMSFLDSL